jgi:hypothetical protein
MKASRATGAGRVPRLRRAPALRPVRSWSKDVGTPPRKRAMEYQLLMEVRDEAGKLRSR